MTDAGGGDRHRAGPLFWISAAAGWAVMGFGLRGIVEHSLDTRPAQLARFVVAGALLHDLVVAPVVILVGVLVTRAVPRRGRAVVQGALAISAVVALFSYPLVRAYGLAANNPTSLPHNYARNLVLVLGLVWAAAGATVLVRLRSSGSSGGTGQER